MLDNLHNKLLSKISDIYQKSEGFPLWDILRAVAFGFVDLWTKADEIEKKQDVNNLIGTELERYVQQRKGLYRKQANKAVGSVTIVTGTGTITEGALFETAGGVQFESLETKEVQAGDTVEVRAVVAGIAGNVPADTIVQMPVTIAGISQVTNPAPTSDGYDAEADDDLRKRYFEALQVPATSGNIYHYRMWAKEVAGVKDAKVFPLWNGDNTVQVVLIDDNSQPAPAELVERVQTYIDPNGAGTGEGVAPVGAYCTVAPAEVFPVNVSVSVLGSGDFETIKGDIVKAIEKYLDSIAFIENYVSVGKINNAIIDTAGVLDTDGLTVNGHTTRQEIPEKAVAILGEVEIREITA